MCAQADPNNHVNNNKKLSMHGVYRVLNFSLLRVLYKKKTC
jgi:hypothetical protein